MSEPTKDELQERAKELNIEGRSLMNKERLAQAVYEAEREDPSHPEFQKFQGDRMRRLHAMHGSNLDDPDEPAVITGQPVYPGQTKLKNGLVVDTKTGEVIPWEGGAEPVQVPNDASGLDPQSGDIIDAEIVEDQ